MSTIDPYGKIMKRRSVTTHQSGLGDINDRIEILAGPSNGGNSPASYNVYLTPQLCMHLPFQSGPATMGCNGLTNEALLAVILDRLKSFQSGNIAGGENNEAINGITQAIQALQKRSRARKQQGVLDKMEKHQTEGVTGAQSHSGHEGVTGAQSHSGHEGATGTPGCRIVKGEYNLSFAPANGIMNIMQLNDLQTWQGWNTLESLIKPLLAQGDLTQAELDVLKSVPTTPAGKNGLAEFLSALNTMRQVSKK